MREAVLALPHHLTWNPQLSPATIGQSKAERPELIVLAGVGGSAMAADIAALAVEDVPVVIHRGYGLPPWAAVSKPPVVAISYSGNTEETLDTVDTALRLGMHVAVVTTGGKLSEVAAREQLTTVAVPGGLQPRAAVGYQVAATVHLLERLGGVADAEQELARAADAVVRHLETAAPQAASIADAVGERIVVAYGAGPIGAICARRLKTQINENAKASAFWSVLPESNHNEIESWPGVNDDRFGVVFLEADAGDRRLAARVDLTAELIAPRAKVLGRLRATGETRLARACTLITSADFVSVELAQLRNVDDEAVPVLENFKKTLASKLGA